MYGLDRLRRSSDLNLGCTATSEEVEEQLAGLPAEASGWLSTPRSDDLLFSCPLQLKARAAQAARQEPWRARDVAPKCSVLTRRVRSWPEAVRPSYVLVMDEELVQVREPTDPSDPEETRRRPGSNDRDELREPLLLQCNPPSFGEEGPRAGKDESRRGEVVVFTEDEVRHEVVSRPRLEKCRSIRAELVQELTELLAFDGVEEQFGHVAGV